MVPSFPPAGPAGPPGPGSLGVLANPTAQAWGAVLSWKKGVEQSGFVWCNPPELLPAPWVLREFGAG